MKKFKNLPVWWENVYKVNQASHVSDKLLCWPRAVPCGHVYYLRFLSIAIYCYGQNEFKH